MNPRLAATLSLLLVVAGCSSDDVPAASAPTTAPVTSTDTISASTASPPSAEPVRKVAEDTSSTLLATFERIPAEGVIYAAPLVLEGVVRDVAGPFWNQASGQKWEDSDEDYTSPFLYRQITIGIGSVLRDDHGVAADTDTFTFISRGGGLDSDDVNGAVGGHFEVGDRVVVFLAPTDLPLRDRPVKVYATFFGSQGVYQIEDDGGEKRVFLGVDLLAGDQSGEGEHEPVVGGPLTDFVESVIRSRDTVDNRWEPYRVRVTPELVDQRIEIVLYFLEHGEWPPPGEFPPPGTGGQS